MDWFSWLSKTRLHPSLVYEYGLALTRNELEEDDIGYFTHEFLQSMGISIAKHRLEILKLARKENKVHDKPPPLSKLMVAINRTKNRFAKYITTWARCEDPSLAIVPRPRSSYSARLRGAMVKRNQKLVMSKQGRLLLTNGNESAITGSNPRLHSFSSPMVYDLGEEEKVGLDYDGYWCNGVEEIIRWDSMFQDLKPT